MLSELELTNFKSFAGDAAPIPFAPVTILVGANASGKSNVFDAIRFLQGLGSGLSIAEILTGKWEGGREIRPALRGGVKEICWAGEKEFKIRTSVELVAERELRPNSQGHDTSGPVRKSFTHQIVCRVRPEPVVASESLRLGEPRGFEITSEVLSALPGTRSRLHELADQAGVDARHIFALGKLLTFYRDARFFSVRPASMRRYVPLAVEELGEHGENLSAIVWRICRKKGQKEQFLDWLAALCAPQVTGITFDRNAINEVLLQLAEGDGKEKTISALSVSDGTLRFMGILAAMFSAPEGSLFLLEEIENGLHPTRVHLLVELLEQFAESRSLQIVGTTHSTQVLLSLSEHTLRNAVLFARSEETPGTITRRLGDLPHFDTITQKTQIDSLFSTGWLEQAL